MASLPFSRVSNPFFRWGARLASLLLAVPIIIALVVAFSVPWGLLAGFNPGTQGQAAERVIFANVSVLPMTGEGLLENRFVVVEEGRITAIEPALPDDVTDFVVIDGHGQTLMPGLIDMHVHVFDRTDMLNYVTHGVTTVRNMMGMPMHLRWREGAASGELPGPRLITASPTLNQGEWAPFHRFVDGPEDARERVREYADRGYDLIKVYEGLEADVFSAIMEEASAQGLAVTGHQPNSIDLETFLSAGIVSMEHAEDLYGNNLRRDSKPEDIANLIQRIEGYSVPLTPTLMAYRNLQLANASPDEFFASIDMERINPIVQFFGHRATADMIQYGDPERIQQKMDIMMEVTRLLYANRGGVILGTDTSPAFTVSGETLHDEIALIASTGVPAYEILYSGTVAAANALGMPGETGIIAEGAFADIILVDGNPLDDLSVLRDPQTVIASGRLYQENDLEILRENGTHTMSAYATIGWLIWHELTK